MEGADLVNVALGALINLAEHAPEHRARFAAAPLPGGRRLLPLLCRVLQARPLYPAHPGRWPAAGVCCAGTGCIMIQQQCLACTCHCLPRLPAAAPVPAPEGARLMCASRGGAQATAALPGSPATPHAAAGEVTEAALAARQEQGVASFAEFYAAVLLGILVEQDAALRQARGPSRVECLIVDLVCQYPLAVILVVHVMRLRNLQTCRLTAFIVCVQNVAGCDAKY